jgi:hypothetical protein
LTGSDVLTILAEVFIAFAGFTGIVATLGQRSEGKWRPVDVIRFRALLEASLAGLILCVLPFGFHHFAVAETITWGVCSAIVAVYALSFILRITRKQGKLRVNEDPDFVPGVRLILVLLTGLVVPIQALNAVGIGLEHTFSGYLVGLIYLLILCSSMFVLLLRFVRTDAT